MWLLFVFLVGTDMVIAENTDEEFIDGELSRKILGQSVVTSVSVVMDIGNGTKTIFTDTLGKPVEKPISSSDLASPINLLNPDRYEFYTFDDNGNLVRRLMSLEEIKGIIATGDSDGLEYDSVLSESYIPEKRVNDVLSNVQNVLKEEMEIHNTKLDEFPTLDTPDVSDSWNMILPAVFGNSGADFTPEKPAVHVTPDTIMIEPTEHGSSTPRATPVLNSSIKEQSSAQKITDIYSISTSNPTTPRYVTTEQTYSTVASAVTIIPVINTITPSKSTIFQKVSSSTNSAAFNNYTNLNTESKEDAVNLNQEYIPISTLPTITNQTIVTDKITSNTDVETSENFTSIPAKTDYIKIEQPVTSTENSLEREYTTELLTTYFTTSTATNLKTNLTEIFTNASPGTLKPVTLSPLLNLTDISTTIETSTTDTPELTIQSVESSINCTSVKNDSDSTTAPLYYELNSVHKIAAPEILNQLLSTPLVNSISTDIINSDVSQVLNDNDDDNKGTEMILINSTNFTDRMETTAYITEAATIRNIVNSSYNGNISTVSNSSNTKITNSYSSSTEISSLPFTIPIISNSTFYINDTSYVSTTDPIPESTLLTLSENATKISVLTQPDTTLQIFTENRTKPMNQLSNEMPIKSTKIEDVHEPIIYEEPLVKLTPVPQINDNMNASTIFEPLTLIDSSTIAPNDLNDSTIRVPLIDPSESKTDTSKPTVAVYINENQSLNISTVDIMSSTEKYNEEEEQEKYNENKKTQVTIDTTTHMEENKTDHLNNQTNFDILSSSTESILITQNINTITEGLSENKITKNSVTISKETETNKNEPNWTLVPTIAPHSGGTFATPPPTSENYPDVLEPPESIDLKPEPFSGFGLEDSTSSLDKDIYKFSQLYNELAFEFWKTTTDSLSHARSMVLSPFGTVSLLAMIFLGARGSTSAEMNEILKLDDMITFNPHLVLKNVGESIMNEEIGSGIISSAFIRELFMCRMKGKLLPFYKERVRAFYDGYAEEVNFAEIGDIIRRRTNLQVKKHSAGKLSEFLTDISVTARPPLVGLGVNIFQTDCSRISSDGRDEEMHFTVLPSIRQRRLVPIPAVLYKSGFLAGYEPSLDATAVAIGGKNQSVSTILVMPGQQGSTVPGDGLARLEKSLVESSFKKGAWSRLLRSLIPRSGLEVQIPRFEHRSVVNITEALKKMGFVELFKKGQADLVGMNGVSNELYLSDMIQINQFTTCGEKRGEHHSEVYPNNVGRSRRHFTEGDLTQSRLGDPLHDVSFMDLPLPLRPRQARKPDTPRLRFDRPFLYFIRHNPTGLILHIGRFNPRLLP